MPQLLILTDNVKSAKTHQWETKASTKIQLDSQGSVSKLLVKAIPNHSYRLLDAKTGQLVKDQYLVRIGKTLHVMVDNQTVVELENFFTTETTPSSSPSSETAVPNYVVDTSKGSTPEYGLITGDTEPSLMGHHQQIMWAPGTVATPLADPVAFGLEPITALKATTGLLGWPLVTGAAGVAAVAVAAGTGSKADNKTPPPSSTNIEGAVTLRTR